MNPNHTPSALKLEGDSTDGGPRSADGCHSELIEELSGDGRSLPARAHRPSFRDTSLRAAVLASSCPMAPSSPLRARARDASARQSSPSSGPPRARPSAWVAQPRCAGGAPRRRAVGVLVAEVTDAGEGVDGKLVLVQATG